MAKYASGVIQGPAAGETFFLLIRDHLLANGWSEHDVVSSTVGTRDVVFESGPLDTLANNRCCLRVTQINNSRLRLKVCSTWDASANSPIWDVGHSVDSVVCLSDPGFCYWMRANPYALSIVTRTNAGYHRLYAGFLRRALSPSRAGITRTTASPLASGATVLPVTSDMTGKLQVGQRTHIMNDTAISTSPNKVNAEIITIQSISSTQITLKTALTKNYDAGALVGTFPMPLAVVGNTNNTPTVSSTWTYAYYIMSGAGVWTSDVTNTLTYAIGSNLFSEAYVDPDDQILEYTAIPMAFVGAPVSSQGPRGYLYHWLAGSYGVQAEEDILTDGARSYVNLGINTSAAEYIHLFGPRED